MLKKSDMTQCCIFSICRRGGESKFFVDDGAPSRTTITTMTDGNHGRAVAHIACKKLVSEN